MNILFVSDLHYLPQGSGGCQSLIHEMAIELRERGHHPSVLAPLDHRGFLGFRNRVLMKLLNRKTIRDDGLGYPVYRRWVVLNDLDDAVAMIRPDVAIATAKDTVGMARELRRLSIPTIGYFQDIQIANMSGAPNELSSVGFLTNSQFTQRWYKEKFGIDSMVITPLIRADRYRTAREASNVTMINPHHMKGGNLAVEIARRCPEIPFCLVEAWELQDDHKKALLDQIRDLKNVTLKPRTDNMKSVYRYAKILLAPSMCEEAWGRVVSEAHISGIPVVASNRGGLPEAVGTGGVVLDPDGPVEKWVETIKRLWSDADFYREKSEAALSCSVHLELEKPKQIETLLSVLRGAVTSHRESPAGQKTAA